MAEVILSREDSYQCYVEILDLLFEYKMIYNIFYFFVIIALDSQIYLGEQPLRIHES